MIIEDIVNEKMMVYGPTPDEIPDYYPQVLVERWSDDVFNLLWDFSP
jgi:hypothetical protein